MDNTRYYNDSLAHDFSLFMPREKGKVEHVRVVPKKKAKKQKKIIKMNKKRNKQKLKGKNPMVSILLSAIFLMLICICYLLFMVYQYETGMKNNNEIRNVYPYSSIIDIYEET